MLYSAVTLGIQELNEMDFLKAEFSILYPEI